MKLFPLTLVIVSVFGGDIQTSTVDEGAAININCGSEGIAILSGNYICKNTNAASDKTAILSNLCNDKTSCSVNAYNSIFGDAWPGCPKKFTSEWQCVDPCSGLDCDDGNYCNGEEFCVDGACQPAVSGDIECPDSFVCSNVQSKCARDCNLFAIDGFLRECSAEYESSQNEMSGLTEDIIAVNVRMDIEEARVAANAVDIDDMYDNITNNEANIEANADAVSVLFADLQQAQQDIADVQASLKGMEPLAGAEPAEAQENESTIPFLDEHRLIVGLSVVNVLFMAIVLYQCCESRKHGYQRVVIYPSSDEESKQLKA